jgi:hypothetical protein
LSRISSDNRSRIPGEGVEDQSLDRWTYLWLKA